MKIPASFRIAFPAICIGALAGCASADGAPPQQAKSPQVAVPQVQHPDGESAQWWFRAGAAEAASRGAMRGHAKNLILFVGDGMSLTTVAAARILEGQRQGQSGEEHRLAWEDFPDTALSRTYNTDSQTPDSAGTMSAMATGAKTRLGVLSIGQQAARKDCKAALASPLLTLWELAASSGMATGVVTTARVIHATPGATFAHSADRAWENDTQLPAEAREAGCTDIARQMVESRFGTGPDVLMGGGRREFLPKTTRDPEYPEQTGSRGDGRDLVSEWQVRHPGGSYAWNTAQLQSASDGPLLALFEPDHMHFEHERAQDGAGEPSLADMTKAAISRLSKNPNGYVLLVEGARIDMASHAGNAYRALTETIALSDAVRAATEATSADDTLILVTADHSHTLAFSGYGRRGNQILGKVYGGSRESIATVDPTALARDANGLPYTVLNYASGPGYRSSAASGDARATGNRRPDLTDVDTEDPDYLQEAIFPLDSETHGGDDVGIWATGPGSDAVRGSVEENTVFHFLLQANPRMRAALCAKGDCENGVPVVLSKPGDFESRQ
ncbi:MAG: alkaline phosphatase [Thermomonas sp.]